MAQNIEKLIIILQLEQPSWLLLQLQKILVCTPTIILQFIIIFLLLKICFFIIQSVQKVEQKKKFCFYVGCTIFFTLLLHQQSKILQKKLALVVKESAFVYAGPELSFHTILQLQSGMYVQLLEQNKNMCQIKVHGQQGWIVTDALEIQ